MFGQYRYTGLPMGVCQSSDFAQATMDEILRIVENVAPYIDDIKITHDNGGDHRACLRLVLTRLLENGFTINPSKCQWAVSETDGSQGVGRLVGGFQLGEQYHCSDPTTCTIFLWHLNFSNSPEFTS